jgi:hypothetical protein
MWFGFSLYLWCITDSYIQMFNFAVGWLGSMFTVLPGSAVAAEVVLVSWWVRGLTSVICTPPPRMSDINFCVFAFRRSQVSNVCHKTDYIDSEFDMGGRYWNCVLRGNLLCLCYSLPGCFIYQSVVSIHQGTKNLAVPFLIFSEVNNLWIFLQNLTLSLMINVIYCLNSSEQFCHNSLQ